MRRLLVLFSLSAMVVAFGASAPGGAAPTPTPTPTPCPTGLPPQPLSTPSAWTAISNGTDGGAGIANVPGAQQDLHSSPPPQAPVTQQQVNAATAIGNAAEFSCGQAPGDLEQKILAAAEASRYMSTAWPGTACSGEALGTCACGAAMTVVFLRATGVQLSTAYYDVDTWRALANSDVYGGTQEPAMLAPAGSIIIWGYPGANEQHIGVCIVFGCSETLSNSSQDAEFAPQIGDITFFDTFPISAEQNAWTPNHVP